MDLFGQFFDWAMANQTAAKQNFALVQEPPYDKPESSVVFKHILAYAGGKISADDLGWREQSLNILNYPELWEEDKLGTCKALFFYDSFFKDSIGYLSFEKTSKEPYFFAFVPSSLDHKFCKLLETNGAYVTDAVSDLPKSWHIEGGLCLFLKQKNYCIVYHFYDFANQNLKNYFTNQSSKNNFAALGKSIKSFFHKPQSHYSPLNKPKRFYQPRQVPQSLRGKLEIWGDAKAAIADLQKWGAIGRLPSRVPEAIMYPPHSNRLGLFSPLLDHYLFGQKPLGEGVKKDSIILHYLTARQSREYTHDEAFDNFCQVVKSGGLLSISERARQNMFLRTVSPQADIRMGTDHGVPARIYGKWHLHNHLMWQKKFGAKVALVFRRETLAYRDVWFTNYDPLYQGAFFTNYDDYGQSIGHHSFRYPPSHKIRKIHYRNGTRSWLNEIWFANSVPNHLFAGVMVDRKLYRRISRATREFKEQGLLPPDFQVFGMLNGYITKRKTMAEPESLLVNPGFEK